MQLRDLLKLLWRRRIIVGLVFVCCVGAAAAYVYSRPKRYESTSTITFLPTASRQGQFTPSENISSLLSTYAIIAQSTRNLNAATTILGHPLTGSVSTSTAPGSWVLRLFSEARTPQDAFETVSAVTQAFLASIRHNGVVVPNVADPPARSAVPVAPRPKLTIAVAAVLGLVAGVLIALLVESLRGPASSAEIAKSSAELAEVAGPKPELVAERSHVI